MVRKKSEICRGFTGVGPSSSLSMLFSFGTSRPWQLAMKVTAADDMVSSTETLEAKSSPSLQRGSQLAILARSCGEPLGDQTILNQFLGIKPHKPTFQTV